MNLTEAVEYLEGRGMKMALTQNLEPLRICAETIAALEMSVVETIGPRSVVILHTLDDATDRFRATFSQVQESLSKAMGFAVPVLGACSGDDIYSITVQPQTFLVIRDREGSIDAKAAETIAESLSKTMSFTVPVMVIPGEVTVTPNTATVQAATAVMDALSPDDRALVLSKYR